MNTPHLQLADGTFVYLLDVPEGPSSSTAIVEAVKRLMNPLNGADLIDVRVVSTQAPFLVEVRTRVKAPSGISEF